MKRIVRACGVALSVGSILPYLSALARADMGGTPIGPGVCDYPGTSITFFFDPFIGRGEGHICRFPKEINGSYWIIAYGDYTIGGGEAGPRGGSVSLGAGGGGGLTGFFCLDDPNDSWAVTRAITNDQRTADPNPPGAWKNHITEYQVCKPLHDESTPPPPPVPVPLQTPFSPNGNFPTGSPTNPADPNPLQTTQGEQH